jgi:hypothetical protein
MLGDLPVDLRGTLLKYKNNITTLFATASHIRRVLCAVYQNG